MKVPFPKSPIRQILLGIVGVSLGLLGVTTFGNSALSATEQRSSQPPQAGQSTVPNSDVAERVKKIVVEHVNVDAAKVIDSAEIEDLSTDSLDCVELVMAFEEEFSIEIPDDAAESLLTVGDAIRFIEKAQS